MIREARPDEAETLLAIQRDACVVAFAHIFPPELYPFPDDLILSAWKEALAEPDVDVFVAEAGGEAIGSVSIGGGFLRTLYVVPTHWRTGIGTALHDHALYRMRGQGRTSAKLWTLEENWNARRYYEKRNWRLTEETRVVPFPPNPIDVQYEKKI